MPFFMKHMSYNIEEYPKLFVLFPYLFKSSFASVRHNLAFIIADC